MSGLLIGYAGVSTDAQDFTAQRDGLQALGVEPERVYVDHGLTGTRRDRPGLREALAACRAGDTLLVSKLDRLARSLPDARDIADDLSRRAVRLNLGGSVYDPRDPVGTPSPRVTAGACETHLDAPAKIAPKAAGNEAGSKARHVTREVQLQLRRPRVAPR